MGCYFVIPKPWGLLSFFTVIQALLRKAGCNLNVREEKMG